jgi:hypothetical protein
MYKSGQTPDDVYYSPGSEPFPHTDMEDSQNKQGDDVSDNYLRMKSQNRDRWSTFDDDFAYWNDPRWNSQFYLSLNFGAPIGYYPWGWNSWYSPYYWYNPFCPIYYGKPIVVVNPNPAAYGPRTYNLNTYTNTGKGYNIKTGQPYKSNSGYKPGVAPIRVFGNQGSGKSNFNRRTYSGYESTNQRNSGYTPRSGSEGRSSTPTRSFDSNRSGSSSSVTRSSGSSAPTRTFSRSGGKN